MESFRTTRSGASSTTFELSRQRSRKHSRADQVNGWEDGDEPGHSGAHDAGSTHLEFDGGSDAGDVVRIPPGQKHWHGASPQASMTHFAITEHRDGTVAQWMEKVSDEQYDEGPQRAVTAAPAQQERIAPG